MKGLQLRGKKNSDDGKVVELTPDLIATVGRRTPIIYDVSDPTQPRDTRANCDNDEWQKWAECPRSNQIATYAGTIVDVSITAGGAKGNITIDHHETGLGLVSKYLHLDGNSICHSTGAKVTKGQLLASLSSATPDPHLHFELRNVIDPAAGQFWDDKNSIPMDPTRLLYRWEAQVLLKQSASGAVNVNNLGTLEIDNIEFFHTRTSDAQIYSIPLYLPMTEPERYLITIFEKAFDTGRQVEIEYRDSVFFGNHRIPVSVRIA